MSLIYVTPDRKVAKTIHKEGTGPQPKQGETVVLIYEGRIRDTKVVFDSSEKNKKKFKFSLGKDEVIDGLTVAVSSMKLGEKSTFIIDPEYGYGAKGREPTIPPNAVLEFDIELFDIRAKFYNAIDADKCANQMKEEAKVFFQNQQYEEAIAIYRRAFHIVNEWVNEESQQLKVLLCRNLSICYGKLKNWNKSLKRADYVLKYESGDARALLRKAEAHLELKQFDQAKQAILLGLGVTKNSPPFQELNKKLIEYEKPEASRQNQVFAKMFGK
ncbi:peptidyl-prolyl cis-trans isomerase, FKBP-type family protein [Tritrichomonas foetus]|uniref:peptidylprolyl isomerase n=1 Tax=Tritrichomonas foetus TaxID=1144522 RepID=A0A1J4JC57_9EUKA|nr:peptidyl-prolyl cis-trans isomerase, FKBP-type family protein [Tritrichomonas foetus]|eukprot:OHS95235.1 peptidyl-prolyl cis-trans isomerase, FKBP-type family protein [Tritrichomonas foetus]